MRFVVGAGVARRRRRLRRRLRLSPLGRSRGLARLEQGHEPLGRVAAHARGRVPRLGARRGARAVPEYHRAAGSGRDYHPGRAVAGEDDARRRARRRRRFFCRCPALLQGLEPLRTKRDRRRLPLVLGAGPGDVHAARAQRGERVGDGIGRARVGRRARRVGNGIGAVFSPTVRAYRNRRAGTDAREERLPARVRSADVAEVHEDGARPPFIAVVVVVHVDQIGAELLGVFVIGIPFRLRREQESLRVHARGVVVVVVARGVRFVAARSQTRRPREHHAVAVVVRGHAREDRGPARQISRRGDLQTGRVRGAVVRARGGHAVPRRGLVELPQSPGRGDERRTLLGRGEPVHDSPCAARVRRARHEPRRGPGGQARRVITRGSYGNGNVSRKHVGWRGGVSARGRPSRVIALPRPRGRGTGRVVHQAKRVG